MSDQQNDAPSAPEESSSSSSESDADNHFLNLDKENLLAGSDDDKPTTEDPHAEEQLKLKQAAQRYKHPIHENKIEDKYVDHEVRSI
jgi:hypothetical protein